MGGKHDLTLVNFLLNYSGSYGPWLPLNCLALMTALDRENIEVDFRDYQLAERSRYLDAEHMAAFFDDSADIIAVSCYSHALPFVIGAAERIKQKSPRKKIILGGLGVRFMARDIIENFPFLDVIVTDDRPEILPEIVRRLQENGSIGCGRIPGVVCRDQRVTDEGPGPDRAAPGGFMTDSMIPALEKLPLHLYEIAPVLSAKGCVYKCPFCCVPGLHPAYLRRDIELVKEEILYLSRQNGPKTFYLIDEAFLHDRNRTYELLDFIGGSDFPAETKFKGYGRVNLVDETLMKDMRKAHFTSLYFGVESGSNDVLRKIRKGFTIEEAVETILACRKYLDTVTASFIYGFPFETFDDFLETMYHVWLLHGEGILLQFHLLAPLPGTALYENHRDDLDLAFDIASYMSAPYLAASKENIKPIASLIKGYPHIFPNVHHFKSPRLKEKEKIANDMRSMVFLDESQ